MSAPRGICGLAGRRDLSVEVGHLPAHSGEPRPRSSSAAARPTASAAARSATACVAHRLLSLVENPLGIRDGPGSSGLRLGVRQGLWRVRHDPRHPANMGRDPVGERDDARQVDRLQPVRAQVVGEAPTRGCAPAFGSTIADRRVSSTSAATWVETGTRRMATVCTATARVSCRRCSSRARRLTGS